MAAGIALAVGAGFMGLAVGDYTMGWDEAVACLECIGRAAAIGAAAMLFVAAFSAYAAARRLGTAAAFAVLGGGALGATAVHLTCPSTSPLHHLIAHILAPLIAAALLTAPIALGIKHLQRRLETDV
jgi:hypothetical protein